MKEVGDSKTKDKKAKKAKVKPMKYQSFDDLVTAFDDSKAVLESGKSPIIERNEMDPKQFLRSQLFWHRRTGEARLKANQLLVYNLFRTPFYEENYAFFAIFLCCDVLWYMFSILILRSWLLVLSIVIYIVTLGRKTTEFLQNYRSYVFDFVRLILVFWGCFIISFFDMSYIYHYIRSISGFKTYLIMNILGTFDHLFTSIEHNVSDALFHSLRYKPSVKSFFRFLLDFFFSLIFVSILASVKFLSFMTFNVTLDMNPQTNVIYIISRKFKYIRKTLYKKCDEMNLFDHSCRDIEERLSFLINVVLSLCVLTYTNGFQLEFVYEIALLYLVDWAMVVLKHMILLKQNRWPPEIYNNYTALLKRDVLFTVQNNYDLDPTHVIPERIGVSVIASSSLILHTVITFVLLPLWDSFTVVQWAGLILAAIAAMCGMKWVLSYVILSVCRNGINFVDITTVDNEIVDAEKQMGEVKKEVPEMQLKRMDSLKVKK
ncbi:hypothetical protein WA577_000127, partial [Blastocystis sp. JDR]